LKNTETKGGQPRGPWERERLTPHVELVLWLADARDYPYDLFSGFFDAVYFDPFSPATNPELWSSAVLNSMYTMLAPGGSLTSYCVKGEVRRALSAVGFHVAKAAGPAGGKREVLICTRPA
jgi:tRNA U34 5-methylaminomethyl-2-thiouridine-forming methyltransferase MnmC